MNYKHLWNPVTQSWDVKAAREIMQVPPDFVHTGKTNLMFDELTQRYFAKEESMYEQIWSPVEIETFLQLHYLPYMNYFEVPPSKQTAINELHAKELIRKSGTRSGDSGFYLLTNKGRAFLKLLLSTPVPVQGTRWVDPRTDEILIEEQ